MSVPEVAQDTPEFQHGGVGREDVEGLAGGCRVEGGHERPLAIGDDGVDGQLGVLEAHGHVVGADAGHVEADAVLLGLG
jgi:hypothetical protein